ncbi:MAG: tRNA pseudouridine(38-40) synthase TruA [Halieaceae bacterium]|nr:tRNA pseudouridine(38-40) synthase TruA [Halieaceae bacterium]
MTDIPAETDPASASSQRVALWIEYDGTSFSGWQLQRGSDVSSVQGALESALGFVANHPVRLHCAGRTDAGVHATAQLVHFDANNPRPLQSWLRGANANLPGSVAVRGGDIVAGDFHARFSALSRRYRYLICNDPVSPAIGNDYLAWVRQPLAHERMHEAAQHLLGERDFSSFRAAACQSSTPMRRIDFLNVYRRERLVVIDIQANAFLHHMVRNIAGALIAVGKGACEPEWLPQLLVARDRTQAPDTAPAGGLYLVGVDYPQQFGLAPPAPGPWFLADGISPA